MNTFSPSITESGNNKISELLGNFNFDDIVNEICEGRFSFETEGIINKIISLFLGELRSSFKMVGVLICVVMISALVNNLQSSFEKDGASKAAHFACYIYIATIAITAFQRASEYVYETLTDITVLMQGVVPSMAVLCAGSGQAAMGTMAHPVIFFICSAVTMIIKNVVTPLAILRAATALLCGINQNSGLNEFSELFGKIHKTILALSMTLFAGVLGLSRFAASSFDSLAARGIKFAVASTVPVVGGSLSEALSSVAGSALLLKNAVGITGIIMLFAMFAVPMIKLAALSFLYKISSAIASPIADKDVITTLKRISECIDMLFSSVACMGAIMVIALASVL
ncbi:MAG: stage III sporulation protein AE [Clostridia bacterium]|nr:stage III sporulation protein AE [Clostridia bacterium]